MIILCFVAAFVLNKSNKRTYKVLEKKNKPMIVVNDIEESRPLFQPNNSQPTDTEVFVDAPNGLDKPIRATTVAVNKQQNPPANPQTPATIVSRDEL